MKVRRVHAADDDIVIAAHEQEMRGPGVLNVGMLEVPIVMLVFDELHHDRRAGDERHRDPKTARDSGESLMSLIAHPVRTHPEAEIGTHQAAVRATGRLEIVYHDCDARAEDL